MPGDFRPVVGHRVRFHCDPHPPFDGVVDVEVIEAARPRTLSYTWKTSDMRTPTTVTFTLTALPDGGTRLRLEHRGFTGTNGERTHPLFKDGWGHKLGALLPQVLEKQGARMTKQPTGRRIEGHPVVSHEDWITARKALLAKEKEFSRARERLAEERRALPWEKVEKEYVFAGPGGRKTLSDLFDGRSQLAIYQFMFAPNWGEGCPHCSFWADHYDGTVAHLAQRDVSLAVVSRAPLETIEAFRKRMGWRFRWYSSAETDYNYDFQASFRPEDIARGSLFYNYQQVPMKRTDREGLSVFYKDARGAVFHTYSTYARGIDMLNATYQFLDLVPKGRDENPDSPQDWVRHHDRYTT
jgi:predicted dithiol-disulfide oxidoreductase (DUF899 family)